MPTPRKAKSAPPAGKPGPRHVSVSLVKQSLGPLTYRVPPALDVEALPGARVMVPLARARAVGYIIADAPPPQQPARDILDVLDSPPLLTAGQLELARFASRYYLSPLPEALRLTHPAGLDLVPQRELSLTDEGRLALAHANDLLSVQGLELDATQTALLRAVERKPKKAAALLKSVRGARLRELADLERRSLLAETASSYEQKVAPTTERVVWLEPAAGDMDDDALRRQAPKQAHLMDAIRQREQPVAVAELRLVDPQASERLRGLQRRGLVRVERRAKDVDPLANAPVKPHPPPVLNEDQAAALAVLSEAFRAGSYAPFLLHGVTSSGKTEVYLRLIREAVDSDRSAIVLVPEISLTPQLAGRFRARFPEGVAVLHSGLSDKQRQTVYRRVRRGDVQVVVGARSALFAPLETLGVIVVDEEHDTSFKQEEGLRYQARDLALVRGRAAGAVVVLGSATPSLESAHNANTDKLTRLSLPVRATPQPLPTVEIIDLKLYQPDASGVLTAPLADALTETLASGHQTIIFLNRRGFAPFVLCYACGQPVRCRYCSVSLTLHKRRRQLVCHYCGHMVPPPEICPGCQSQQIKPMGLGTEQVEEVLAERFPGARIGRLDRDTARGQRLQQILDATAAGELDILVGTQMVTKGHDFPGVTLVGVINADHALHLPDFRAAERTFQLLSQVAGRAGRGGDPGRVIVQTYNPEHHAIDCARRHDYAGFYEAELRYRQELGYPPIGYLVAIRVEGREAQKVIATAGELAQIAHAAAPELAILGPSESPIAVLRGRVRWQLLCKGSERAGLHRAAHAVAAYKAERKPEGVRILIDVDPQSML